MLNKFVNDSEFSAANVVSLLKGNRGKVEEAIENLEKRIDLLNEFIKRGPFTAGW